MCCSHSWCKRQSYHTLSLLLQVEQASPGQDQNAEVTVSLPYPMTPALCQNLGFAAKLISGQGALGPTRIISGLLKLWTWAVLLLQSLIHQRNNMMIEKVPIFDSILKSRGITLLTKFHIVKAMLFPVVMYGCENWMNKKSECQRTDAFKLWGWRRLLRVPRITRRSNQSILREINLNIHWQD